MTPAGLTRATDRLTRIIHEHFCCLGPLKQKNNGYPNSRLRQACARIEQLAVGWSSCGAAGPSASRGSLGAENPNLLVGSFCLASRGGAAVKAEILVEVPCRKDEEQTLTGWSGFAASGAVEK
jgi:hypothetical protein